MAMVSDTMFSTGKEHVAFILMEVVSMLRHAVSTFHGNSLGFEELDLKASGQATSAAFSLIECYPGAVITVPNCLYSF